MSYEDLYYVNSKEFRNAIEYFVDKNNEYSKEELYNVFITITRRYLDEVISARQLEKLFEQTYGEKATNEFYEAVANSSEILTEGDLEISLQKDPVAVISAQFDLIEDLNQ